MRAVELFEQRRPSSEVARAGDASRERAPVETDAGTGRGPGIAAASSHPNSMTPRSRRCEPLWNRAPKRTGSRPTCGPWSERVW